MLKNVLLILLLFAAMKVIFDYRGVKIRVYESEGDRLFKEGEYGKAFIFYKNALKVTSIAINSYIKINSIHNHLGRFDEAISICDKFIKKFPKQFVMALNMKGVSYIYSGDPQQALECFDVAINKDPNISYTYFNKGFTLLILGKYDEGFAQLDIAMKRGFDHVTACKYKGIALMLQNKFKEAEALITEAINEHTDDDDLYFILANVQYYSGNYRKALANFNKAKELFPVPEHITFGEMCLLPDFSGIIEILHKQHIITHDYLIQLKNCDHTNNKELRHDLVEKINAYIGDSTEEDAAATGWVIETWTEILDKIIFYGENCGKQLTHQFISIDKAKNGLLHEIVCPPDIEDPNLESLLLKSVRTKLFRNKLFDVYLLVLIATMFVIVYKAPNATHTSLSDIRKSLEDEMNTAPGLNRTGQMLLEGNVFDKAIEYFERAIASDPFYAESYFNKGNALVGLKKYTEAIAAYNQAIALDPNYVEAITEKSKIEKYVKNF